MEPFPRSATPLGKGAGTRVSFFPPPCGEGPREGVLNRQSDFSTPLRQNFSGRMISTSCAKAIMA
jgi:hypothetical protein